MLIAAEQFHLRQFGGSASRDFLREQLPAAIRILKQMSRNRATRQRHTASIPRERYHKPHRGSNKSRGSIINDDPTFERPVDVRQQRIWTLVSRSSLRSLWNLQGVSVSVMAKRTWKSILADRLFGRAAELGFYFLFALFPTLFSASSLLGLAARSADQFYDKLLSYLALVIPTEALGTVLETFNETTAAATPGKLTFGLIAAIWSASVGISAVQDALNAVYKVQDRRSYLKARVYAIGLTIILTGIVTLVLTAMLGGDFFATLAKHRIHDHFLIVLVGVFARLLGGIIATALLALSFAVIYYWAPDLETRRWRWLTPGGALGIFGWLVASLGLRIYLHFFDSYSITYGSLGAVIILLTWFYITGLMLLIGAEINSEIEAAAIEKRLPQV
jgi:membrane protein